MLRVQPPSAAQRILVIDDDTETLEVLGALLQDAGFAVCCQHDLGGARAALVRDHFDLVLTDLYLGDNALGYEIAEIARALRPPVPVIVLTGRPSFANAQDALRSQVCEIVVKPLDGPTLAAVCRKAIGDFEIRQRNQELEAQNRILATVLPRAIEAKDPTTKGHSDRVARYTGTLAQRCQVSPQDREALVLASLLHDVGKVGVPNEILRKDGPLTTDERDVIKKHPQFGFEILEPLAHHQSVRRWVYTHHERWDGRGYPNGLAGEEVDLPGRILILAEVFDALASVRSYKSAWPVSDITAFFRAQAGKQFDPALAHLVADGLDREGTAFFVNPEPSGC